MSRVCKWFDEIAMHALWKEFCRTRAPKMMLDLESKGSHSVDGNWKALAKLLIYCSGCSNGGLFNSIHIPGHFVYRTRFSRTSGKSFLIPQCRTDVLYVSVPCEHLDQGEAGDIGFFRGVFKSFSISKVRKMLVDREAKFYPTEVCPYCKAKLWSMLQAKMIPRSACNRLGSYDDCIEYFVCLNGHCLESALSCHSLILKVHQNWSNAGNMEGCAHLMSELCELRSVLIILEAVEAHKKLPIGNICCLRGRGCCSVLG